MIYFSGMQTNELMLAAFLALHRLPVLKAEGNLYSVDIAEDDALIALFEAPDGYNTNVHQLDEAMTALAALGVEETLTLN